jgi:hypothetical protein
MEVLYATSRRPFAYPALYDQKVLNSGSNVWRRGVGEGRNGEVREMRRRGLRQSRSEKYA